MCLIPFLWTHGGRGSMASSCSCAETNPVYVRLAVIKHNEHKVGVYARAATSATSHPASTTTNITGGMYARAATSHPASTRTQVVVQRAPRSEKQNGNGTLPFFGNTSHQLRNKRVLLAPTSDGTLLYVPRLSHSKSELLQKSLATEMTENIS